MLRYVKGFKLVFPMYATLLINNVSSMKRYLRSYAKKRNLLAINSDQELPALKEGLHSATDYSYDYFMY